MASLEEAPARGLMGARQTMAHNAFSIDVEDWYHDETRREGPARPAEIARTAPRVGRNLTALLDLLAESGARATLFFLADVALRAPALVRDALARGHEIACHGLRHRPVAGRTPAELREDLRRAKATLEDAAGVEVVGFRAPCFLRGPEDLWALDAVVECGFRYDSSYLPLHWRRGPVPMLSEVAGPVRLASGLWEFPLPLSRLPSGHMFACAAGGFALRALPYAFTRRFLAEYNRDVGPAVLYTHPWEIDPGSPKLPGTPFYVRFFNGLGRAGLAVKLRRLFGEFRFAPLVEVYSRELGAG